jgi:hypothetical protein
MVGSGRRSSYPKGICMKWKSLPPSLPIGERYGLATLNGHDRPRVIWSKIDLERRPVKRIWTDQMLAHKVTATFTLRDVTRFRHPNLDDLAALGGFDPHAKSVLTLEFDKVGTGFGRFAFPEHDQS